MKSRFWQSLHMGEMQGFLRMKNRNKYIFEEKCSEKCVDLKRTKYTAGPSHVSWFHFFMVELL
jgi:hypothetical protein